MTDNEQTIATEKAVRRHGKREILHLNSMKARKPPETTKPSVDDISSAKPVKKKYRVKAASLQSLSEALENGLSAEAQAVERFTIINPRYKKAKKERDLLIKFFKDNGKAMYVGDTMMVMKSVTPGGNVLDRERLAQDMASVNSGFQFLAKNHPAVLQELAAQFGDVFLKAFVPLRYFKKAADKEEFVVQDREETAR